MQRIEIRQDFSLPVERVYGYLAEHENLGPLFGATVERVRDGDGSRNGVGSVRRMKVGPLPWFEETNTQVVPNELIEYRITRGGILNNHRGEMRFSSHGTGSRVDYVIEFDAKVPLAGPLVKKTIEGNVRAGLREVEAKA
jgi:uncharacterized membrane protein